MVVGTLNALPLPGQIPSSEIDITSQRFWVNGVRFGDPIPVGDFNSSSNLTTDEDADPIILRNVKRIDSNQAEINGVTLPLPFSEEFCQFHIHVESDTPIAITDARFYAYNGINDVYPFQGIDFYAVEANNSIIWIAANGSSQALPLSTHPSSLTHDWFIAVSASPTSTGTKQGKLKFVYTYS